MSSHAIGYTGKTSQRICDSHVFLESNKINRKGVTVENSGKCDLWGIVLDCFDKRAADETNVLPKLPSHICCKCVLTEIKLKQQAYSFKRRNQLPFHFHQNKSAHTVG